MVTLLENHHPDELDDWITKFDEHETVHNKYSRNENKLKKKQLKV